MYRALLFTSLFTNNFFCLSSACLSNKSKTKAQVWFICKQTNMNKFFIEPSSSCSWTAWFVYNPSFDQFDCVFLFSVKLDDFAWFEIWGLWVWPECAVPVSDTDTKRQSRETLELTLVLIRALLSVLFDVGYLRQWIYFKSISALNRTLSISPRNLWNILTRHRFRDSLP